MTIILGAMDGEIVEIGGLVENPESRWIGRYQTVAGRITGHPVLVSKSGVGKTYSAMLAQRLIDEYRPTRVIVTGLAGSINPELDIGDTLVARDCMQHDLDASAVGFVRGEFPYENVREIACDAKLVSIGERFVPEEGRVHVGRVLTGDQFMDRARLRASPWLRHEPAGDVVEMEGASVGAVCRFNDVPFLLVRTVSDKADENARVDFERFLSKASRNSAAFVAFLLESL
ncbi:MAG: 5'-methylthioadenosine/adenosylhomocysteine nucleosidase [Spirochaetales bacterium]